MNEAKNWDWMAEKEHKRKRFYYTNKDFIRNYRRDKTDDEAKKITLLGEKMQLYTDKINSKLPENAVTPETSLILQLGYTENRGYYVLEHNDKGHYSLPYGLPNDDVDVATMLIIRHIIWFASTQYETINHNELEDEFNNRFREYDWIEYCQYFSFAEYCLSIWKIIFDNNIPKEVVDYFETYLNDVFSVKKNGFVWKFEDNQFVLKVE